MQFFYSIEGTLVEIILLKNFSVIGGNKDEWVYSAYCTGTNTVININNKCVLNSRGKPLTQKELALAVEAMEEHQKLSNKYHAYITNHVGESIKVDVYDVLDGFPVTNPAYQHLIKKALFAGMRGHKDTMTDAQDIIDSAVRGKQIETNKKRRV